MIKIKKKKGQHASVALLYISDNSLITRAVNLIAL